ncbi:glycoside hydrolase family 3 C-terminal domain-containing protein [Agromyces atrinae]|nr:glycoside hydrolase family 3 C-terminal domain-containing protein [Agromyces atrinae]MCI2957049.1 glycoside hydrolase family 3 C-terminal domain-containing protein [Agromyces atrinae]
MTTTPPDISTATADEIVANLTLDEKASLTSGASFWYTKPVERAGIPAIMLTDGPHGLRKQREGGDHLGIADSVPATCFPPAVALGSSFDPELLERVGAALGDESLAENVAVLLGPGINIKRSPLCGRNFEYLSEDPLVSGVLGTALVRGLQSRGVGASLKHFAANNQEADRLRVSADVDPRPLREIYLRGFQRVVEDAQPWTVMCSYNRLNGVWTSEDPWLLTSVLRDEWGFDGLVVSDWGAVNDRVTGVVAGLDLEMPSSGGRTDAQLVAAVQDGRIAEASIDTAARRVVDLVQKSVAGARAGHSFDVDTHHALAREAAERSVVLLKNEGPVLPLAPEASVAVIGEFARTPRFQGAGSSLINPTRVDDALAAITGLGGDVAFAPGFTIDGSDDTGLATAAAEVAAQHDVAVVFLGLPAELESEGFDRDDIELPANQIAALEAVAAANPNTVVVLSNGGVVRLGDVDRLARAIVEGWLLGQAGGSAIANVLFGVVNPAGRLAETIPVRIEDTPAFLDFPGENSHVRYGEGLFVGYRWYDARSMAVHFPFGHGLSYTEFAYSDLSVAATDAGLTARLTVTNTGERAGREVVQAYVGLPGSSIVRAQRELKGFQAVDLDAGESRVVEIAIRRADLAYWDVRVDDWTVEGGEYRVEIGASSRDIRVTETVAVDGDVVKLTFDRNSSIGEILADETAGAALTAAFSGADGPAKALTESPEMIRMMASFPIGRLATFPGMGIDDESLDALLAAANAR